MADHRTKSDRRYVYPVADLSNRGKTRFEITPDRATCAALANELGVRAITSLRFDGALSPDGKSNWRLDAVLKASVVQNCVITLEKVTSRIEESVFLRYLADPPETPTPGSEVELIANETEEPLGHEIDLWSVVQESLALALPAYPRKRGAQVQETFFSAPGVAPMTDDDARPFASLAELKAKLDRNS